MATYDNTYSRVVAWLKVLLPLIALGLLSTMFLISRQIDPTRAIPFTQADVEGIARDERITGPSFAGVTDDGAAVRFVADSARPAADDPERFSAVNLDATIDLPEGGRIDVAAPIGDVDGAANTITLTGGVELESTIDYHVTAAELTATMDLNTFLATGNVRGQGPLGRIISGQATLERGDEPGEFLLVFKQGVNVLYDPTAEGSD